MEKWVVLVSVLIIVGLLYVVDSSLFYNVITNDTEIPEQLRRNKIETIKHLAFFALFLILIYTGSMLLVSGKGGDDI